MVCAALDLLPPPGASAASSPTAAVIASLHSLFALYLEFKHNPAFEQRGVFGAEAAAGVGSGGGGARARTGS